MTARAARSSLVMLAVVAVLVAPARAQPGATEPPAEPAPPSGPPGAAPDPGAPASTPPTTPADALRDGNAAATAGDWATVSRLVDPLLRQQLPPADLAEAHRLAGLSAFFQERRAEAEEQFLAYLRIDLDGQLDPALYPPEVILFFNDVKAKHTAELRARRPRPRRWFALNLVPAAGQFQNGERTKGIVIGGLFASFAITNVTSFLLLRSWCTRVTGDGGSSLTCDDTKDRAQVASTLRAINIASGVGLILTYAYGVYDGVRGYRRRSRERAVQPYVTASSDHDAFIGVAGSF